jgi:hypothetical protein
MEMQVWLKAKSEGREGHMVLMQVSVVGSAV